MSFLVLDLEHLYRQTFGSKPYVIDEKKIDSTSTPSGKYVIQEKYLGKEIWLPVRFYGLKNIGFSFDELLMPYTVVKINGDKNWTETSLAERKGSVKELFNISDYSITIKGFAIDDQRRIWPEEQLIALKQIFESEQSIGIDNALINVFLEDMGGQVAIKSLDLPEVEGGRKHVRPFVLTMKSDSVFDLIVE
jgi:hypothetical protein